MTANDPDRTHHAASRYDSPRMAILSLRGRSGESVRDYLPNRNYRVMWALDAPDDHDWAHVEDETFAERQ